MFDLYKIQPFRPILLVSENVVDGRSKPCHTAAGDLRSGPAVGQDLPGPLPRRDQRRLHHRPGHRPDRQRFGGQHPPPDRRDGVDPRRSGVRRLPRSVGLSNFTVMLPPKRADGSPVKGPVGKRLPHQGHAAGAGHGDRLGEAELRALCARSSGHGLPRRMPETEGFDVLMRVREFYAS